MPHEHAEGAGVVPVPRETRVVHDGRHADGGGVGDASARGPRLVDTNRRDDGGEAVVVQLELPDARRVVAGDPREERQRRGAGGHLRRRRAGRGAVDTVGDGENGDARADPTGGDDGSADERHGPQRILPATAVPPRAGLGSRLVEDRREEGRDALALGNVARLGELVEPAGVFGAPRDGGHEPTLGVHGHGREQLGRARGTGRCRVGTLTRSDDLLRGWGQAERLEVIHVDGSSYAAAVGG